LSRLDFPKNLSAFEFTASWAFKVLPRAIFAEALWTHEIRHPGYLKLFSALFAAVRVSFRVPADKYRKNDVEQDEPQDSAYDTIDSKEKDGSYHYQDYSDCKAEGRPLPIVFCNADI
jgi:hypothetical protein